MDYAVFSALGSTAKGLKSLLLTYDIACSWSVHFFERLELMYGDLYQLDDDVNITFAIPKFHIQAHGLKCQENFNLNYLPGAGRTCGEGIEAGWADCNGVALSTRESGPAHRRECLDDLFGAINWRKTLSMGMYHVSDYFSLLTIFRGLAVQITENYDALGNAYFDPNKFLDVAREYYRLVDSKNNKKLEVFIKEKQIEISEITEVS